MDDYTQIARDICCEMGVEWDESADGPTIAERPVTAEDIETLFQP